MDDLGMHSPTFRRAFAKVPQDQQELYMRRHARAFDLLAKHAEAPHQVAGMPFEFALNFIFASGTVPFFWQLKTLTSITGFIRTRRRRTKKCRRKSVTTRLKSELLINFSVFMRSSVEAISPSSREFAPNSLA